MGNLQDLQWIRRDCRRTFAAAKPRAPAICRRSPPGCAVMCAAERFRPSHHTLGRGTLAANFSHRFHRTALLQDRIALWAGRFVKRSCTVSLQAGTEYSSTCPPEGGRYIICALFFSGQDEQAYRLICSRIFCRMFRLPGRFRYNDWVRAPRAVAIGMSLAL